MNHRQRTRRILHYEDVDRLPVVHFGYWPELLWEWAAQGHIPEELARTWGDGNAADRAIDARIGWDFNWFSVRGGEMGLRPHFTPEVLETLPERERKIIVMRFGLYGQPRLPLNEISVRVGLTRERVRQLEKKVLETLRSPSKIKYIEGGL